MSILQDSQEQIALHLEQVEIKAEELTQDYITFFKIEEIFSSENGGKTRLNRQLFTEKHEDIVEKIVQISTLLDEALDVIKVNIKNVLIEFKEFNKVDLINLVFDDANFLELLEMDLNTHSIPREKKRKIAKDIKELLSLKNRIFNYKHYLEMFDTTIFDKLLNKLGVEELINSSVIFQIIDSYGLQFEELQKFKYEIKNLNVSNEKAGSFQFLNSILELYRRRVDNFFYANTRYKITLEYSNDSEFSKDIEINKPYLENILSCFVEQSCMDLVKQELKKGKIQKFIDISIERKKGKVTLVVKNNGFEIKNIYSLFVSDIDNKYILEARNLAKEMNAVIDIQPIENEGMLYSVSFKA